MSKKAKVVFILFVFLILLSVAFASVAKAPIVKGITERAMLAKESYDFHKTIFSEKYNLVYSNGRRYTLQQYLTLKGVEVR